MWFVNISIEKILTFVFISDKISTNELESWCAMGDKTNQIGKILMQLRISGNLSQQKLSENIDIAQSSIGNYERGDRIPDAEVIMKYCKYFSVSSDYILGLSDYLDDDEKSELEQEIEGEIRPYAIGIYREINSCMEKMQKLSGYAYNKQEYLNIGYKFNDLMFSYLMGVINMYDEIAEQANSVEDTRPCISEVMEAYTKHTLKLKECENKTIQLIADCIINGNIQK
jgi:transcriptional regulator with XRE-family HTH domain